LLFVSLPLVGRVGEGGVELPSSAITGILNFDPRLKALIDPANASGFA
jgi:hypothetical protein